MGDPLSSLYLLVVRQYVSSLRLLVNGIGTRDRSLERSSDSKRAIDWNSNLLGANPKENIGKAV